MADDEFLDFLPIDWSELRNMSPEEKAAKAKKRVTDPHYLAIVEKIMREAQEKREKNKQEP